VLLGVAVVMVDGWIPFFSVHSIDNLGWATGRDGQADRQIDREASNGTNETNTSYFMVKLMCKYETKWCFSTPN